MGERMTVLTIQKDQSMVSAAHLESVVQKQASLTADIQGIKAYVLQMRDMFTKSTADLMAGAAASNAKIQQLQEQVERSRVPPAEKDIPRADTLDEQRVSSAGPERGSQTSPKNQKDGSRATRGRGAEARHVILSIGSRC
jgi:hypothetical protein